MLRPLSPGAATARPHRHLVPVEELEEGRLASSSVRASVAVGPNRARKSPSTSGARRHQRQRGEKASFPLRAPPRSSHRAAALAAADRVADPNRARRAQPERGTMNVRLRSGDHLVPPPAPREPRRAASSWRTAPLKATRTAAGTPSPQQLTHRRRVQLWPTSRIDGPRRALHAARQAAVNTRRDSGPAAAGDAERRNRSARG